MQRIFLFLVTNMAVLFIFAIILNLLGIQPQGAMRLLMVAGIFGFTGSFISLWFSKQMALRAVGGQIITTPQNEMEAWLLDTVKELAEKDSLPMPEVAIYYADEMNAFATGATKNRSLVAVSSGLLETMTRAESQAVLAHEISHIKNGDMVTMALLQGVLNTFVIFISRIIANAVASSRDGEFSRITYFLISMGLEMVFGILASIIAMWFSRQREFRADAGAAKLVGKEGMINALKRLEATPVEEEEMQGSLVAFGINGKQSGIMNLFLSHPPIEKRIDALKNL